MFKKRSYILALLAAVALFALSAIACGAEIVEVPGETVVKEVVKEVEVPGETVIKEVVKEVEVPGETVIKEVVKEVEVPGETVVVKEVEVVEVPGETIIKEVVKEVEVPGETVVVKEVELVEVQKVVEVPVEQLDPLIVGNLNGFTGPLTEFATPLRNSVALAANHVNRAGGVQGASMLIISRDTAVNPVQGVDSARALVDVENAVAIVGALSSGVTIAVASSVTVPQERLLISGASTAPAITVLEDNDFLFRTAPSDAAQGVVLANLANDEGYKTAGIIYLNNAYGEGLADQFEKTFTELGGTVTGKSPHEDAQPTYVSELQKATEGDPDVLVTISYPGQAEIYLREAIEGGYADTFLFVDGTKSPEMVAKFNGELDGTLGTAPGGPGRPEKTVFEDSYLSAYGYPVSHPFMAEHYDATVLIALAAAKAGSTTDATAIRDALRDVANAPGEIVGPGRDGIFKAFSLIAEGKDINYEGASGIVDLDENGDVFGPIEIWMVENGEIVSTGRFETP